MTNIIKNKTNDRLQWFYDRIGKKVFRTKNNIYGSIKIFDRQHANYLFLCENELGIKYFDTKKEVKEYGKN